MKRIGIGVVLLVITLMVATGHAALSFEELNQRLAACSLVLNSVLEMPDRGIPKDLLKRCRGLAIFPGVIQAGVVVGVAYGNGVVFRRDEQTGTWSKPTFFTLRGGSLGAQVGAQSVDLVLLVMSERGLQGLLEEQFTLGADIAVAAGPLGREAAAKTNLRFDVGILSYSRSKGLFAGVSLSGARLQPDMSANELYHGKGITVQDVLYENKGSLSDSARNIVRMLDRATP